jgi:hypothetical protein
MARRWMERRVPLWRDLPALASSICWTGVQTNPLDGMTGRSSRGTAASTLRELPFVHWVPAAAGHLVSRRLRTATAYPPNARSGSSFGTTMVEW